MPPTLTSARRNYAESQQIARRAVREARKARPGGTAAVASVVATHQIANAQTSQSAVSDMLFEQAIEAPADALLNLVSFATDRATIDQMLVEIQQQAEEALRQLDADFQFDRLVESLVQDAGRAAESVAIATRNIWHVRFVNLPCCSRCAILAGRVYRWSDGFKRHPGCDCTMIPTTVASPLKQDPAALVESGQVTGLSKADRKALDAGADLNRIVNARLKPTSLMEAGQSLRRNGRPTPAGIFRRFPDDRDRALAELQRFGYLR